MTPRSHLRVHEQHETERLQGVRRRDEERRGCPCPRQLNAAAHGHIHETMGGSWNHYYAEENAQRIGPAILTFAHEIQALAKELWRKNYVTCPDYCSMDTPWRDCQCECSADSLGDKSAYEILDDAGVLDAVQYFDQEGHLVSSWKDGNGTVYYTLPATRRSSHTTYTTTCSRCCAAHTSGHVPGDLNERHHVLGFAPDGGRLWQAVGQPSQLR